MKIFKASRVGARNTLFFSPGADHPEVAEWMNLPLPRPVANALTPEERQVIPQPTPKTLSVVFVNGEADVDTVIGEYLVEKRLASKKPQPALG